MDGWLWPGETLLRRHLCAGRYPDVWSLLDWDEVLRFAVVYPGILLLVVCGGFGADADAHPVEFAARLGRLRRLRIALDQGT